MDAGQWSSSSTFYRYYEKALTSGQVQTLRQIPVFVSARDVVFNFFCFSGGKEQTTPDGTGTRVEGADATEADGKRRKPSVTPSKSDPKGSRRSRRNKSTPE